MALADCILKAKSEIARAYSKELLADAKFYQEKEGRPALQAEIQAVRDRITESEAELQEIHDTVIGKHKAKLEATQKKLEESTMTPEQKALKDAPRPKVEAPKIDAAEFYAENIEEGTPKWEDLTPAQKSQWREIAGDKGATVDALDKFTKDLAPKVDKASSANVVDFGKRAADKAIAGIKAERLSQVADPEFMAALEEAINQERSELQDHIDKTQPSKHTPGTRVIAKEDTRDNVKEGDRGTLVYRVMNRENDTGMWLVKWDRDVGKNEYQYFITDDKISEVKTGKPKSVAAIPDEDGEFSASAIDKVFVREVKKGMAAHDALDLIAKTHDNKFIRYYARWLRDSGMVVHDKITVGNAVEDYKNQKDAPDPRRVAASYNVSYSVHVYLDNNTYNMSELILHELTHSATVHALEDGKTEAARAMKALYSIVEARVSAADKKQYGFTNVKEFVAEAFSNPKFQEFLKNTIIRDGAAPRAALWEKFKNAVKNLIGVKPEGYRAYDLVMAISPDLFAANKANVEEYNTLKGSISTASENVVDTSSSASVMAKPMTALAAVGNNPKFVDIVGAMRRGKLYVQFLSDIGDNYGDMLKDSSGKSAVGTYIDKVRAMAKTANDLLKTGGDIAERWASLRGEASAVSDIAADATQARIHPDIPLNLQEYQSNGHTVSNKHLANEDGTFDQEVVDAHRKLQDKWASLSDKAKGAYKDSRNWLADSWNKREQLLNKRVKAVYDPLIEEAQKHNNEAKVKDLQRERDDFITEHGKLLARVEGPYFPMRRFGKYYVVYKSPDYVAAEKAAADASSVLHDLYIKYDVGQSTREALANINTALTNKISDLTPTAKTEIKDARAVVREANKKVDDMASQGSHYTNEAFESEGAATARAAELGTDVMLKDDYMKQQSPVTRAFLARIGEAVAGTLPEKQAIAAKEAMTQIWLQSLPDTSAMRSELKRRSVQGFSRDMLRAFSQTAQSDAHHLSRLEHIDDVGDALLAMKRASKEPRTPLFAKELYQELGRRHVESIQFVDNPIANAMSAVSFVWQLGISPAFLLTNLSQPWMISMPYMSGRHGLIPSVQQLGKAFSETSKAISTAIKKDNTLFFEIDKSKFGKGVSEMLHAAESAGKLELTLEADLSAMSKGEQNPARRALRAISAVPHQVEVMNRVMTAIAAYRMELKKTGSHEVATEYAIKVLDKTHIDYSATNAPSPLKPGFMGGYGKVILQYRKYQLGMLSLVANQYKQAMGGSPEAKRALLGMFAMHGAIAGALGLPLIGTAMFVANAIHKAFGDTDEPWDAEVAFRNWLADVLGVEAGAVAAKGLPMLAGLDVSRRIGLGDIGSPIKIAHESKKGRDFWLEVLAATAGPTLGGLMPQMAEGVSQMGQGEMLKGTALLMPRVLADPMKAYATANKGVTTSRGAVAVSPDKIDAWDLALQGIGMPASILTERNAAVTAVEDRKTSLKDRRGALEKEYVNARVAGDTEALAEVQAAVAKFNETRRGDGEPPIKPVDLINAYKQRKAGEKNMTPQGVGIGKRDKGIANIARFADVS